MSTIIRVFLTVAEEVLELADTCVDAFESEGYTVTIEDRSLLEAPYLPTLTCERGNATMFVEVCGAWPGRPVLREWTAFCKSQSRDTRFALAVSDGSTLHEEPAYLVNEGIGIFFVSSVGALREIHQARDQTMDLELPTLTSYQNEVRAALGEAWDELRRGNWKEGFNGACIVLETECRAYILRHVQHGRLTFVKSTGKAYIPSEQQIDHKTMGQLVGLLGEIATPNHGDSVLHSLLHQLNDDRILVAHKRQSEAAERRLRQAVPQHLWRIVRGVAEALK